MVSVGVRGDDQVDEVGVVVRLDVLDERVAGVGEPAVDHDDPLFARVGKIAEPYCDRVAAAPLVANGAEVDLVGHERCPLLVQPSLHSRARRTTPEQVDGPLPALLPVEPMAACSDVDSSGGSCSCWGLRWRVALTAGVPLS